MARINRGLFSSLRGDWKTPKALYQALDAEFNFDYDPCPVNPKIDGLESRWGDTNFVNPPYGKEIGKWIKKGYEEYLKGKTVVFLLPSRTDTRWWHDYIMKAAEIRFIRGRLKFDDQKNAAPFPSAIVVFEQTKYGKQDRQKRRRVFVPTQNPQREDQDTLQPETGNGKADDGPARPSYT